MEIIYKITNVEIFEELGVDVDTSGLKFRGTDERGNSLGFTGSISIKTDDKGWLTTSGQFSENDYNDKYGFAIITQKYIITDRTNSPDYIKPYIDEDGYKTGVIESAEIFNSEEEAQLRIETNEWSDWASIEERY